MTTHIKQTPQRLPADLLEGFERRLSATSEPRYKLPEYHELRAIGLRLLAHIAWQEQEVAGN